MNYEAVKHPLTDAVIAKLGGRSTLRFSEASRISGTSLPTFYTQRNLGLLGYLDENGKRIKADAGYTITVDQLIRYGWLDPEEFLAEASSPGLTEEHYKELASLREQVSDLKAKLDEANMRLRIREEDLQRLEAKLYGLEAGAK